VGRGTPSGRQLARGNGGALIPDDDLIGHHLDEAARHLDAARDLADAGKRLKLDSFIGVALLGVRAAHAQREMDAKEKAASDG
jgi:hypothetical protein